MCRISFWLLIVAAMAATGSNSRAAGSFQTKPAFQSGVTTGTVSPTSSVSTPNTSSGDFVGGCGRGRVRDPQTHTCRGPADIR
jgi:hypothetical protein